MLLAAYVIGLAVIAFSPTSIGDGSDFGDELRLLGLGWVSYEQLESAANVILFIPFGLLITFIAGARRWWIVAIGLGLAAAAIEVGQALFLPGRIATIDDVLANTAGGLIGIGIACLALLAARPTSAGARA